MCCSACYESHVAHHLPHAKPDAPLRTQLQAGCLFHAPVGVGNSDRASWSSVPAMSTQLYNTDFASVLFQGVSLWELMEDHCAFLRAILYIILTTLCLSAMGRWGLAPAHAGQRLYPALPLAGGAAVARADCHLS